MAYASAIEIDVTDDEDDTIPFFEENNQHLQAILLKDVSDELLTMVSDLVSDASASEEDSPNLVRDLLQDGQITTHDLNLELIRIKKRSFEGNFDPLLYALRSPLKDQRSLSTLIKILLKRGRIDVVRELRPPIEAILIKRKSKQYPRCALQSINSIAHLELRVTAKDIPSNYENLLDPVSLERQQMVLQLPLFKPELDENSLTVFVPHATQDEKVAREFQSLLIYANIIVKLLVDIQYHITGDSEVLHAVLKYVDFVVPVISKDYLNLIYPRIPAGDQTDYSANNRFIYKWMLSEYTLNNSFNFRVRPVSVPELNVQHVRNLKNPILSYPFQLFQDVPKLIEMLNKSRLRNSPCIKRYDEAADNDSN